MVLLDRGLAAAENLLVARFTMFTTVYLHKTVRIASRMLQEAIFLALEDGTLDAEMAVKMTDSFMLESLLHSAKAEPLVQRLKNRWLYKKAYSFPIEQLHRPKREAEQYLSEKCGCAVLLDVPALAAETKILMESEDGKISPLASQSELVASLQKMQKSRLTALAICAEKDVRKVADAAGKMFR
jgi:HD superfamily phosphohydrolase